MAVVVSYTAALGNCLALLVNSLVSVGSDLVKMCKSLAGLVR